MILKVNSEFLNLSSILNDLKHTDTLFYNNTLYISFVEDLGFTEAKEYVKSLIKEDNYIVEITEFNLSLELPYVVNWCKDQFVRQDKIRYEKQFQNKLQNIMVWIDKIEQEVLKEG